jgi:oligopeptide transport system substrate-binding protein
MRSLLILPVLVVVSLALGSCSSHGPIRAACPAGKQCMEIANGPDPSSLDPNTAGGGTWEGNIFYDVMDGLTIDDKAGGTIPGVATSWETSPDGLTWTFHLRNSLWSDGEPVTADDFVFSWERVLDPKTAAEYASLIYFIKNAKPINDGKMAPTALGVEAADPHTLVIHLEHPAPFLLEVLKHQVMLPVPKHAVLKWGDRWATPEHYVDNGPYLITGWKLGDRVHAVKNPRFSGKTPLCVDEINWYTTLDPATAERRFRSGEIDHDTDGTISSNRIDRLRRDLGPGQVHVAPYLGVGYLAFNERLPKFKDARVRNALSMAIDRDFVTQKLLRGARVSTVIFVPPGVANYQQIDPPYWAKMTFPERQTEARRLLAAAGYGPNHPLKVEIKHRNSSDPTLIMPAIQSDWKEIGVQATLASEEVQIAYQDYKNANFEIADAGWIADYNDPMTFLYLFDSRTGDNNYGGYNNAAYDHLIDLANAEKDLEKRKEILRQAEMMMQADQPIVPLWDTSSLNLVSPRIASGYADNINDHHPVRYMCMTK